MFPDLAEILKGFEKSIEHFIDEIAAFEQRSIEALKPRKIHHKKITKENHLTDHSDKYGHKHGLFQKPHSKHHHSKEHHNKKPHNAGHHHATHWGFF